jgi:hypothetical protein
MLINDTGGRNDQRLYTMIIELDIRITGLSSISEYISLMFSAMNTRDDLEAEF